MWTGAENRAKPESAWQWRAESEPMLLAPMISYGSIRRPNYDSPSILGASLALSDRLTNWRRFWVRERRIVVDRRSPQLMRGPLGGDEKCPVAI